MASSADELGVVDYMRLMKAFLDKRIDARNYARSYFDLAKRRVNIVSEEASRITQQAYGDADDYEPDAELRQADTRWIAEVELRERVAKSLREFEALGYRFEG